MQSIIIRIITNLIVISVSTIYTCKVINYYNYGGCEFNALKNLEKIILNSKKCTLNPERYTQIPEMFKF